ncbi:MAG: helix-hairpin-helix domain-containing protein [Gaiellaceae bacterium]
MSSPATPDNEALATALEYFASLLELGGSSTHSVRAYRRAAGLVRGTATPVAELVRRGEAQRLRGIGPSIEQRLVELVQTGELREVHELEDCLQPGLVGLGRYLGVNPRLAAEIGRTLRVTNLDDLRAAAAAGRLLEVPGIGPAREQRIVAALAEEARPEITGRTPLLNRARAVLERVAREVSGVAAGDVRRWRDRPRELAVVTFAPHPEPVVETFCSLPDVVTVVERSERRAVGVTVDGLPVELVVAEPGAFGTELLRATGSREYVAALEPLPAGVDEERVYAALGVPWCPPELREAPFRGEPPTLVEVEDIRGDLHTHTVWSDGKASVRDMGEAAIALGYEYLAICDHTRAVTVVPGLGPDDVRRQAEEIQEANELLAPFRVLRGIECDILADGSLDLPDDVLFELDWVMASVHAGQRTPRDELTRRVVTAMEHPSVSALSHATGRIINHRPPNAVDLEVVVETALRTGVALEVNGLPDRLDLRDEHVRLAVEGGAEIVCSTDAHSVRGLGNMELSVRTARRGWATAANVVNTRPLGELLARRRAGARER